MIEFFINNIREIENSKSARENIRNLIGIIPNLQFIKENFLVRHNKSPKEKILVKLIIDIMTWYYKLTEEPLYQALKKEIIPFAINFYKSLSETCLKEIELELISCGCNSSKY